MEWKRSRSALILGEIYIWRGRAKDYTECSAAARLILSLRDNVSTTAPFLGSLSAAAPLNGAAARLLQILILACALYNLFSYKTCFKVFSLTTPYFKANLQE